MFVSFEYHDQYNQSGCFYLLESVFCSKVSEQAFCNLFFTSALVHGVNASRHGIFVPTCGIHGGQPHIAPRSFLGVEDYFDDDNSRTNYYRKGKKSRTPNMHVSFKQRTIAYMEPFMLDVFISNRFVSTSRAPRIARKWVAVVGANSKDIKAVVKREPDVYAASYTPGDREKFEGKIRTVVQSLIDIDIKIYLD
ncbi:hypothetical protein EUGRSUZ_D01469 [Eucalyptus grandis]|uniref:Uncharacterized protein n=2 Tax=Eucalyptus grandis TaxID=71139 RepID=A0ACC3L533_EUCGR|nr:hypothetical protein EUGRSUZ_D01469 [Eucalyptus grandis]